MRSNYSKRSLAMLLTLTGLGTASVAPAAPLLQVSTLTPPTAAFARGEWRVDVGQTYANPYDPRQISVDATFVDAAGDPRVMPAFWRPNKDTQGGAFYVRFAPDKPGPWTMHVDAVDTTGKRTSTDQKFDVAASNAPGLVRVADNKRYFRYDNGQTYFPIGINLAWPPGDERAAWYDKTFADMNRVGATFARVWMAHGPVVIETSKTGLGRYDETNAAYYDAILESADKHGVRVMLCFLNHRDFLVRDMWGPAGWPTSPYNAANGGPATLPGDVFTNDDARRHFRARLRYVVARYAAYTGLGFWELMNEQEFTPTPVPAEWDREMADYLTATDPYRRLVSTSAHVPDAVWQLPNMALTQAHLYGDGNQSDLVPAVLSSIRKHEKFAKPHLIAEYGIDGAGEDGKFDPAGRGTAFHNALWSAALGGSAGTTMHWWWDNYIWPKGLWRDFKPLADFVKPVHFAGKNFAPVRVTELRRKDATGYGDLTIPAAGGWGGKMDGPQTLPPNGRPEKPIVTYLCGPGHAGRYAPVEFDMDFPADSKLTLRAGRVNDYCLVRVSVDGKPIGETLFSATPGSPGIGKTEWTKEGHGYRAEGIEPRTLAAPIPAGRHRVTLDAVAGDWVTLSGVTFSNALDNHYAHLDAVAVQDGPTKETLAWVYDTRSTWKTDRDGPAIEPQSGVTLVVPNVTSGTWTATWWDTRAGRAVSTVRVSAKNNALTLDVPTFTRDIALRLSPADATAAK